MIFSMLDQDDNGFIEFIEFVDATRHYVKYSEERMPDSVLKTIYQLGYFFSNSDFSDLSPFLKVAEKNISGDFKNATLIT